MRLLKSRRDLIHVLPVPVPQAVVVELGCAEGLNAADMLGWGIQRLYMVDSWTSLKLFGDAGNNQEWHNANYEAAVNRVSRYGERAVVKRGLTTDMAKEITESIDLAYVDACHTYEAVRDDIMAYWPKLRQGGIMAFHDLLNFDYGVYQAVVEFASATELDIHLIPETGRFDAGCWVRKE